MSRKHQSDGFTLVELLVVIGIIAVMISILLPAINKAKQAAVNIACASNLRQLGQAYIMYANSNKGFVPLGRSGGSSQYNFVVYVYNGWRPPQFAESRFFGMLIDAGALPNSPGVFYCPAAQNATNSQPNSPTNPWPSRRPLSTTLSITRSAYGYRPTENDWSLSPATPTPAVPPLPKLDHLKGRAILSDSTSVYYNVVTGHRNGVNVAYSDGSCKWVPLSVFKDVNDGAGHVFKNTPNSFNSAYNKTIIDETVTPTGGIWGAWDRY